jgi:hypothetical protein
MSEQRDAGVKFARGQRYFRRTANVWVVLHVTGRRFNMRCRRIAVRQHVIEAGRLALYDIWHPVWFLILSIAKLFRNGLGTRAEVPSRETGLPR